jgi:DNA replication protein DnaC
MMEIQKLGCNFSAVIDDVETERIEQERQKQDQQAKEAMLQKWYEDNSGAPKRYWAENFNTFNPRTEQDKKALEICKNFAHAPKDKTLILCGTYGTGKTHLACSIIQKNKGIYTTLLKVLYGLDSCASFKAQKTKAQFLDELSHIPLLVIDEIGRGETESQEKRQAEIIYYIFNERYGAKLPTVLCSNLSKENLVKYMGEAVRDRLNETCIFCELTGSSYREAKRNAD